MVVQQLQMVKTLLEQDPPDVKATLRELNIAMEVAVQEHLKESQKLIDAEWANLARAGWTRPNDELLKEFGW